MSALTAAAFGETNLVPADVLAIVQAAAEIASDFADRSFFVEECGEVRHFARGGFWNARAGRGSDSGSLADAKGVRAELRAAGYDVTFDEADALLSQAIRGNLEAEAAFVDAPAPVTIVAASVSRPSSASPIFAAPAAAIAPSAAPKSRQALQRALREDFARMLHEGVLPSRWAA